MCAFTELLFVYRDDWVTKLNQNISYYKYSKRTC